MRLYETGNHPEAKVRHFHVINEAGIQIGWLTRYADGSARIEDYQGRAHGFDMEPPITDTQVFSWFAKEWNYRP